MRLIVLLPEFVLLCLAVLVSARQATAADPPTEADYYPITRFEVPEGVVLEPGGFQLMPNGQLAVSSRRGEIWMIDDPFAEAVQASF